MDNHNPVFSRRRRRVITEAEEVYFPDEILVEIISRLPAKTALICRCVCKRWRDLTWTPDFLALFSSRRSPPVILFQKNPYFLGPIMHFFDNWCKPGENHTMRQEFPFATPNPEYTRYHNFIQFSHDGFVVLKRYSASYIVHNPIYNEYMQISLAPELSQYQMHGVFFHHSLKEYCTLWRVEEGNLEVEVHYKILNLGSNPCWREISNPWNNKVIMNRRLPVLVGGYLYWMVKPLSSSNLAIMEFDTNNEEFNLIPCLGLGPTVWSNIHMLNIDRLLSLIKIDRLQWLAEISTSKRVHVNVWTLQAEKSWKKCSYNISLGISLQKHTTLKPLAVWDGELFLEVDDDLFVCNLKMGTSSKFTKENSSRYKPFYSHAMNLASLKNCKSEIYMNKQGEADAPLISSDVEDYD